MTEVKAPESASGQMGQVIPATSFPTVYELATQVKERQRGKRGRATANTPSITKGLTPIPFENKVGYRVVSPAELASLRVPVATIGATVTGYQRALKPTHAFEIAWAMQDGSPMATLDISLDEEGTAFITDGQHRCIASIISGIPLEVVVKQRSQAQAREMFINQTFAKKLDKSHTVLVGTDPMSLYVQDALTDPNHAWHHMVGERDYHKLTPSMMHRQITSYGCNTLGSLTPALTAKVGQRFDKARADELAEILGVFGKDQSGNFSVRNHPIAYKRAHLSGITQAAVCIMIRASDVHPAADKERWMRHMPLFNWAVNAGHLSASKPISEALIDHWNKKMSARRVTRQVYNKLDS